MKVKIGILVSGGGSNFQAILESVQRGDIPYSEVALLISNKKDVGALEKAQKLNVESLVLEPGNFSDRTAYYERIVEELKSRNVSLVCLAGFLLKVEPNLIRPFEGRILNIHPALLPKYGGKGMFGRHVHEAVIQNGEKESGCTVHLVDEEYDHGPILAQAKVSVFPEDTPVRLAARILEQEHKIYSEVIKKMVEKILKKERIS